MLPQALQLMGIYLKADAKSCLHQVENLCMQTAHWAGQTVVWDCSLNIFNVVTNSCNMQWYAFWQLGLRLLVTSRVCELGFKVIQLSTCRFVA